MKNSLCMLLACCMMLVLPACSTTQSTQISYVQACAAYGVAFNTALNLRLAGKLSADQIAQVTILDSQITPVCTGPLPADTTAATAQITAAVANLAIIESIK